MTIFVEAVSIKFAQFCKRQRFGVKFTCLWHDLLSFALLISSATVISFSTNSSAMRFFMHANNLLCSLFPTKNVSGVN